MPWKACPPYCLPIRDSAARLAASFRTAVRCCQPHLCPRTAWAMRSALQPREKPPRVALFYTVKILGAEAERAQRIAARRQRAPGIVAAEHQLLCARELHHRGEAEGIAHARRVVIELLQRRNRAARRLVGERPRPAGDAPGHAGERAAAMREDEGDVRAAREGAALEQA